MTEISARPFGQGPAGEMVELFTFRNTGGLEISITNYGGRVVSVLAPDRDGTRKDVALGFDSLEPYLDKNPFFGALVGRYANRIANARFELNGRVIELDRNNGENSLHGGFQGFDKRVWQARVIPGETAPVLELRYLSPDGEGGYPGNLAAHVNYVLTSDGELQITYRATTDRKTIVNLTNHSYFDLSGEQGRNGIADHEVTILADWFTPVNKHLIPTGELAPVEGTAFDFRTGHRIGERIDWDDEQLKLGLGYDHNFALNGESGQLRTAAKAIHRGSGRLLEVLTTEPGVQFYSGNHLDGACTGKGGAVYGFRTGFCLETQHFPDSPNRPEFPTTVLNANEELVSTTVFRFSTEG